MNDQEKIKQLQEQVKMLRAERDRFERDLHDERQYLQGTPGEQPYYVRMRAMVRRITERTDELVRQLRAHLPPPTEADHLWDTDWDRLYNLKRQLLKLANEIEELDQAREGVVDASTGTSLQVIEGSTS